MKNFRLLAILMAAVTFSSIFTFTSCNKDEDKENSLYTDSIVGNADAGTYVSGTYTGKLVSGGEVIRDAYVVTITRISSSMVKVNADLFNGSVNFNVSSSNGQYILSNSEYSQVNISIQGKSLTITFLNIYGTITTFTGYKD